MRRRHVKFVYIQVGGCGLKYATFYLKMVQLFYANNITYKIRYLFSYGKIICCILWIIKVLYGYDTILMFYCMRRRHISSYHFFFLFMFS